MSTGVIGVQLPLENLLAGIPGLVDALNPEGWPDAARAIMTTDTQPKLFTRSTLIDDLPVTFTGIAKGAGMIHPDMATMLSVIATDAAISQPLLQQALSDVTERSYNRISIDGDTSTNDTVILLANGLSGAHEIVSDGDPAYGLFIEALGGVATDLAQAIVRDGEGATRFVSIQVTGARSTEDAHRAANTIATSPLVKTAFFGGDANWGRILAAAGRSGAAVEPERVTLHIDGGPDRRSRLGAVQLVAAGQPLSYSEEVATAIFAQPEIDVLLDLGLDSGSSTVWTSDLSYDYVRINGDYRT
jgi:glutamate N-acetyltransferase/amino-acid N-acetyltransferase